MAVLDSKFDILRGWPNGGAVAHEVKRAATTQHNPQTAGKWVKLATAAGPIIADAAVSSAGDVFPGLVLEGLEEGSSSISGTCTVLLGGGYIVRLENKTADSEMFTGTGVAAALRCGNAVGVTGNIVTASPGSDEAIGWSVGANVDDATGLGTLDVFVSGPQGDAGGAAKGQEALDKIAQIIVEIQAVGNGDAANIGDLKTAIATIDGVE